MVQRHCSTASQRGEWVSQLIAHRGSYGEVTQLSQTIGVSRQTLSSWKATGRAALEQALRPASTPAKAEPNRGVERAILTLLVEGHASYRGIQRCLLALLGVHVSRGKIVAVVQSAGRRAQQWMSRHMPATARAGVGRDVRLHAWRSLSQRRRCTEWGSLGEHQSGRSGWGELDLAAVGTGGARAALV